MSAATSASSPRRRKPVPAIEPKLRVVLVAVLDAGHHRGRPGYLAAVTFAEWSTGETFQNWLYQWMFLAHLVLGILFVTPFLIFGVVHMLNTRNRKNRRAVRVGYALFTAGLVVLISGGLLFGLRATNIAARFPAAVSLSYWGMWSRRWWPSGSTGCTDSLGHESLAAGLAYAGVVAASIVAMVVLQAQDPRNWNADGPAGR